MILDIMTTVQVGAGGTPGTCALQIKGLDGTWRNHGTVQPVNNAGSMSVSTTYGPVNNPVGPCAGVRYSLTGLSGGTITYMEIIATVEC
jgi:hypothetical protein